MDTKRIVDAITEQMDITWGGSGFERVVFEWIVEHVPKGSFAIEFGAGFVSTKCLSVWCNLWSVEHDERFMADYPTTYIKSSRANGYDWDLIPPLPHVGFVLIDGIDRRAILSNLDKFNKDAIFLIHDTNRPIEIELANDLAKALGREVVFHTEGDFWATI